MNTVVQKQLKKEIKRVSKVMGVGEKELVERAMRFYLASVKQELALQDELDAWERASDETLTKMDTSC
ncbi:MAG: hypothetical protein U1A28_05690 [Patescibacteria group bacterium]|nr:hypothetical protein [Patescibacteria group bacterium]